MPINHNKTHLSRDVRVTLMIILQLTSFLLFPFFMNRLYPSFILSNSHRLVLLIICGGLSIKFMLNGIFNRKLEVHTIGYEYSFVAFSAFLSSTGFQIISKTNTLPGLSQLRFLGIIDFLTWADDITKTTYFLFCLCFLTLIIVIFTGRNSQIISNKHTFHDLFLKIVNVVLGLFSLSVYLLLLLVKV